MYLQAFKKMSADGAQQMKLNAKMEALLAIKQKEVQSQKVDLTKANAKIIQLASEAQALRNLVAYSSHPFYYDIVPCLQNYQVVYTITVTPLDFPDKAAYAGHERNALMPVKCWLRTASGGGICQHRAGAGARTKQHAAKAGAHSAAGGQGTEECERAGC